MNSTNHQGSVQLRGYVKFTPCSEAELEHILDWNKLQYALDNFEPLD